MNSLVILLSLCGAEQGLAYRADQTSEGVEYVLQVEPGHLQRLANGDVIISRVPLQVRKMDRLRVHFGQGTLPTQAQLPVRGLLDTSSGWLPSTNGGVEFIVQIYPAALSAFERGEQDVLLPIPKQLVNSVGTIKLQVGVDSLPQGAIQPANASGPAAAGAGQLPALPRSGVGQSGIGQGGGPIGGGQGIGQSGAGQGIGQNGAGQGVGQGGVGQNGTGPLGIPAPPYGGAATEIPRQDNYPPQAYPPGQQYPAGQGYPPQNYPPGQQYPAGQGYPPAGAPATPPQVALAPRNPPVPDPPQGAMTTNRVDPSTRVDLRATSTSDGESLRSGGPAMSQLGTWMVLMASLAINIYLGWICMSLYERCRSAESDLRDRSRRAARD